MAKHPGGRPTEYTPEMAKKAAKYLSTCKDEYLLKKGGVLVKVNLPSIAGLAIYLGVARSTIYEWKKNVPEFSDNFEAVLAAQEKRLVDNGLSGTYNSTISKVMLTKHGYSDKQEIDHTTGGKPLYLPSEILSKNGLEPGADGDRPR
jgi:hypothetical protein